jgi:hypothetical protein
MKIFKFKHYKKNLDWGGIKATTFLRNMNEKFLDL